MATSINVQFGCFNSAQESVFSSYLGKDENPSTVYCDPHEMHLLRDFILDINGMDESELAAVLVELDGQISDLKEYYKKRGEL